MNASISLKKLLLASGAMLCIWYTLVNIIVPFYYPGYDTLSQTVSELSAIDAPTRPLWVTLGSLYPLLLIAFSIGIIITSKGNRLMKISGYLILAQGIVNIYWPPMHQREVLAAGGGTLTDTLHLAYAYITVVLMMAAIILTTIAIGGQFRVYSIITLLLFIVFGSFTGIEAPNLEKGLPTPYIGIWERINIGLFMVWLLVLSMLLMKRLPEVPSTREGRKLPQHS